MKIIGLLFLSVLIVISSCLFFWCTSKGVKITERYNYYIVDSVDYHPPGRDNTLQVTPYWRVKLLDKNFFVTTYKPYSIGDTLVVIERYISK